MRTGIPMRESDATDFVANINKTSRVLCPVCASSRRKKNPTLRVTVNSEENVFFCHHCEWQGAVRTAQNIFRSQPVKKIPHPKKSNPSLIEKFFTGRGITLGDSVSLPAMTTGKKFFNGSANQEMEAIGFVYGDPKQPSAIKWRSIIEKNFTQDGAAKNFYGIDLLEKDQEEVVIVEGEADVVALASIGIRAISVPNGAPQKISHQRVSPEEDGKFSYVWEARDVLENAQKIILAVDADQPGEALAHEIARRVGRAKCWTVTYPDDCKDVTDALGCNGSDAVEELLKNAKPMPLEGVFSADDYRSEVRELWSEGYGHGVSTGIDAVDEIFTVKPGQLSIVTGLPSHGKSEFIDQVMLNLAMNEHWKFAVASFENPPAVHIAKLIEKFTGKPFFDGPTPRATESEREEALDFIDKHFVFLENKDGSMSTIDSIIQRTKDAILRMGCRGLVVDPFNYISQPKTDSEHAFITEMLSRMSQFAKAHDIHIWFVAHPAKMYPREDGTFPVPKGQHISGSAAWNAKADLGITVHRGEATVEVHCWKSRFKWVGQQGLALLEYDPISGRYSSVVNDGFKRSKDVLPNSEEWASISVDDDEDDLPF